MLARNSLELGPAQDRPCSLRRNLICVTPYSGPETNIVDSSELAAANCLPSRWTSMAANRLGQLAAHPLLRVCCNRVGDLADQFQRQIVPHACDLQQRRALDRCRRIAAAFDRDQRISRAVDYQRRRGY